MARSRRWRSKAQHGLDQQIELMQAALDSILSDMQVLDNLKYLVNNRTRDLLHTQALWEVTVALNQWFFAKNFNRVLFYNIYGDLAASYNHRQEKINTAVTLTDLPWLESVRNRKGVARLIAPREDEWTAPEGTKGLQPGQGNPGAGHRLFRGANARRHAR